MAYNRYHKKCLICSTQKTLSHTVCVLSRGNWHYSIRQRDVVVTVTITVESLWKCTYVDARRAHYRRVNSASRFRLTPCIFYDAMSTINCQLFQILWYPTHTSPWLLIEQGHKNDSHKPGRQRSEMTYTCSFRVDRPSCQYSNSDVVRLLWTEICYTVAHS